MVYEPDGSLLVCEHVTSRVVRIRPDGDRQVVAFHYEGTYLNSPNDVVVKSDGAIYFSDPDYGRVGPRGRRRSGRSRSASTASTACRRAAATCSSWSSGTPSTSPTASASRPTSRASTSTTSRTCRCTTSRPDGSLANGRVIHEGIGDERHPRPRQPRRDEGRRARQRLVHRAAAASGCSRPTASSWASSRPRRTSPTSTWGDEDWKSLYIPSSTSLYRIRTKVGPARLPYHP